MREVRAPDASTLRDYLAVARRRKWLIVQAIVIVPIVALVLSSRQQALFQSSAKVLLNNEDIGRSLTGTLNPAAFQQPERAANTQADVARSPLVAQRVLAALSLHDRTPDQFLAGCGVSPQTNADILTFTCTDPDRALVPKLATTYARQYAAYRRQLDTTEIDKAHQNVVDNLAQLRAEGKENSKVYESLSNSAQELETLAALRSGSVTPLKDAQTAVQVSPKMVRNGLLGLVLGVVLGLGLAFVREALDQRVRGAEEIGQRIGLPLLARLPEPSRRLRAEDRLVMLEEPNGTQAEAFRVLRTNVDFANLDLKAKVLMITSAVEAEGKSTTVANLAVAFARSGRRVVLVDLDLRRPFLDRFFPVGERPGLTHVALGRVDLEEALLPIPVIDAGPDYPGSRGTANGKGNGKVAGVLELLLSGPLPPNAGEFAASRALGEIIERLRERADVVLIDAPPLLRVNDGMALSTRVDGVVVVTRLSLARRPMLDELRRVLEICPAPKLGFVMTDAEQEENYRYGYGYGYGVYGRPTEQAEREPVV